MSYDLQPWYAGTLSRQEIADALFQPGAVRGDFVVRASETTPGTYVISVRFAAVDWLAVGLPVTRPLCGHSDQEDKIRSWKILRTKDDYFFITEGTNFPSLESIVSNCQRCVGHLDNQKKPTRTNKKITAKYFPYAFCFVYLFCCLQARHSRCTSEAPVSWFALP